MGIMRFNPRYETMVIYKPKNNRITELSRSNIISVYEDRSGSLWFGTLGHGLNKASHPKTSFLNFQYRENKKILFTSLAQTENGTLWIGSYNNGLFKLNFKNKTRMRLQPVPSDDEHQIKNIYCMAKDISEPVLWIGMRVYGLWKFNYLNHSIKKIYFLNNKQYSVSDIYQEKNGTLWVGTFKHGLFLYDTKKDKILRRFIFKKNSPDETYSVAPVKKIFPDLQGKIWVALKKKLGVYNPKSQAFEFVKADSILSVFNGIHTVHITQDGLFWIGTYKGMLIFDPSKQVFREVKEYPDLRGVPINSIIEDHAHCLWIGTNNGLLALDPSSNYLYRYSQRDGLTNLGFFQNACLRLPNNYLVFGTMKSVVLFQPFREDEEKNFKLIISNFEFFTASDSPIHQSKKKHIISNPEHFTLPYDNYSFNIEFALTDYSYPSRNRFIYKLEGMDNEWHSLGNRHQLNLVNLPPKTYTLYIKGSNYAGIWTEPLSISFTILPPFWQTWWFRISAMLMFFALIWLLYFLRISAIRRRNLFLEEINTKLNNQVRFREQVENLLRESENKYRMLVESIKESIYSINIEGVFTFLNHTAAKRLGGKPEDFVGRSLSEVVPRVYAQPMLNEIREVIKSGKGKSIDADIILNGKKRYFHISIQPIPSETGIVHQALSIATETTERITLEERLRQAQKMEAIGKLAGGIAHDFNNLLSIIRGYTYLLLQDYKQDQTLHESLRELDLASERAQNLTQQLLAFSRRQLLKPRIMDLNQQIKETGKMLKRLIGENITLRILTDKRLCPIFADPGQIGQIIMNLAVNARDAMPQGGVLTIETKAVHSEPKHTSLPFETNHSRFVLLSVCDTGIGMDKETISKIFEPFFTAKEKGKGTGLGLSTVFGIVKQSNGYIWVDSTPGKGSCFNIYFPCADKQIEPETKTEIKKAKLHGNERILLVEDEVSLSRMVSTMLKQYGYDVLQAYNAEEALEIYKNKKDGVDMIITDIVMPGMNGIDMVKHLTTTYGEIPVLYISGYTDNEIIQRGLAKHGLHFLQKPFTPDQITEKIREILDSVKNPTSN